MSEMMQARKFRNPILPGCHPDPSICRVGEDYFVVNSSFEFFPGLPLFHSRDLVNWRPIGHAFSRTLQLNLDGIRPSGGLYAPTLRFHDGTFYIINTLVDGKAEKGNFIITTKDIEGEWSDPHWLEGAEGIDPSLFFDEDGRAWYTGSRQVQGSFWGHCEIWLQELDLGSMRLTGPEQVLWDGAMKGATWAESPHIYKVNGWYYLMIAEGGTDCDHAVTMARSQKVQGPYEGCRRNPILTHRHLGLDYPIVATGHADLVETQNGEWWMVLLAARPYGGYYYNLGRETFLAAVRWEDGWPLVNPGIGRVTFDGATPDLPEQRWEAGPACDHFEANMLDLRWNFLRTPREDFWSLSERPGYLRMHLQPQTLAEWATPSFIGRRQEHMDFTASTAMEFTPKTRNECAGMVLMQNNDFHFRFVVTEDNGPAICLVKREKGKEQTLARQPIQAGRTYLKVSARGQAYSFFAATEPGKWMPVAENVDGRILSTQVAGGFVGAYLGLYASSDGKPGDNYADFDWFEYLGRED